MEHLMVYSGGFAFCRQRDSFKPGLEVATCAMTRINGCIKEKLQTSPKKAWRIHKLLKPGPQAPRTLPNSCKRHMCKEPI